MSKGRRALIVALATMGRRMAQKGVMLGLGDQTAGHGHHPSEGQMDPALAVGCREAAGHILLASQAKIVLPEPGT